MKRVMVIGCPGSGKSTFSRALHALTGLPLVYMDMLFWNADKTTVPKSVLVSRVQAAIERETWIIDGNYQSTLDMRMKACDTVFFLDYPLETCLDGIEKRKGQPRPDMPWVEPEDKVDEDFLCYIRAFPTDNRPFILELLARHKDKRIVVFHTREEAKTYLDGMRKKQ